MAEPVCAKKSPYVVDLEAGTYWWCSCGKSMNQPFCDGSHTGSKFSPVKYQLETAKKVAFCGCKRTGNQPCCDGTHSDL